MQRTLAHKKGFAMYFPAAEITVSPFTPFACAFGIAYFCSMTGISGAFLLLPWQISFLHYTAPGVSATNQIFNILACPAGVWRYWQEGRILFPLTILIVIGTLPGVFAGALIRMLFLYNNKNFLLFVSLVLFYLGYRLFFSIREQKISARGKVEVVSFDHNQLLCKFQNQIYSVSCPKLVLLSLIVGLAGGIYGVGGGAIMVPFLVSIFNLPIYIVAGASLLSTFITSLAGVAAYAFLASVFHMAHASPDWILGGLLGLGGIFGMYLGAYTQKYVPGWLLKLALAITVSCLAIIYLFQALQ